MLPNKTQARRKHWLLFFQPDTLTVCRKTNLCVVSIGHDLYLDPPLRPGLGPDHLCFADATGQMAAAAHRPLGSRALPRLFRGYIDRVPRLAAPVVVAGMLVLLAAL